MERPDQRVFIRFRRGTDGNLADGWTIDDLELSDRAVESVYPIWDGFESGTGHWLAGSWTTVPDSPYAGTSAAQDTVGPPQPTATRRTTSTSARELDLTTAEDPTLTYFIRGTLATNS